MAIEEDRGAFALVVPRDALAAVPPWPAVGPRIARLPAVRAEVERHLGDACEAQQLEIGDRGKGIARFELVPVQVLEGAFVGVHLAHRAIAVAVLDALGIRIADRAPRREAGDRRGFADPHAQLADAGPPAVGAGVVLARRDVGREHEFELLLVLAALPGAIGALHRVERQEAAVVGTVRALGHADLAQVVDAIDAFPGGTHAADGGQQECRQHGDDRHDHQEFAEREGAAGWCEAGRHGGLRGMPSLYTGGRFPRWIYEI